MQTDSELESDTSSKNDDTSSGNIGGGCSSLQQNNNNNYQLISREHLEKRSESLIQENRVVKMIIETFKLRVKGLQEENKELRNI
jgi:hypothetical protein